MHRKLRHLWLVMAALGVGAPPLRAQPRETAFLGKPLTRWTEEVSSADAVVRRSAAFALGKAGAPAIPAVPKLVRTLKDPDAGVREAAAYALGEIGPSGWEETLPALIRLVDGDRSPLVRRSAAFALGRLGRQTAATEIGAPHLLREALERGLKDPEAQVRQNIAWALGQMGADQAEANAAILCRTLTDSDPLVRRDAAAALGELGPGAHLAASSLLARFKEDTNADVRRTAMESLVSVVTVKDRAIASELRSVLSNPNSETARDAALALGKIGGADAAAAVPILCASLQDRESNSRRQASAALGCVGPEAAPAVASLTQALSDRDAVVRRNAALALGHIGVKSEPAVPVLARLMAAQDERDEVRVIAGEALMEISPAIKPAVPKLIKILKEERNPRLRQTAVLALGRMGEPDEPGVTGALTAVLSEEGPEYLALRYDAAVLLGILLGPRVPEKCLDVLAALLRETSAYAFLGTGAKVGNAGKEARGVENQLTRSLGGDCRYQAALAVERIGRRANRPDIIRALKEAALAPDLRVREAANSALRRIQQPADQ
jgi:HEAT repeat protein